MNAVTAASLGVALVLILVYLRWKWREIRLHLACQSQEVEKDCPPSAPVQMVHRLCPHHNVVQRFEVEQKDSLDEHLDVLTRKLAEKEGRLRLSKSKIRETQNEIESLHAIDHDVRLRYREIMESLRKDLLCNEKECKKLQEQIEWVSRRRAQLKEEVAAFYVAAKAIEMSINEDLRILWDDLDESSPRQAALRRSCCGISEQSCGITTR
ncbi:uncharacterized protein LOC111357222 isoform X2 [Spodoptera litura]|uniref:Uncharacterized protein LOC111357222 isoform X2 n=1 Tax=Spodoptera litura TaxID=69820 RepID=A0A9J7IWH9_SPOLT|nr:uncharacterized protein LOC111357222 isoform X2 [Spodoptera litura]